MYNVVIKEAKRWIIKETLNFSEYPFEPFYLIVMRGNNELHGNLNIGIRNLCIFSNAQHLLANWSVDSLFHTFVIRFILVLGRQKCHSRTKSLFGVFIFSYCTKGINLEQSEIC